MGAACWSRHSKNQVGVVRTRQGRNACSTLLIVDGQSVKNSDTACHKGDDGATKVAGIQRHIAVDTQGFRHAVAVTPAEVTDRKGLLFALKHGTVGFGRVPCVVCDSASVGAPLRKGVRDILGKHVTGQIAKRTALHPFKIMPTRWIVARRFAWLEKTRR